MNRIGIGVAFLAVTLAGPALAGAGSEDEAMIELAFNSGCFNCHDVDQNIRGPAWRDVAKRYRGDAGAFDRLVVKVRKGGGGVWGDDLMSPNTRVPEKDIHTLVRWLLTLE